MADKQNRRQFLAIAPAAALAGGAAVLGMSSPAPGVEVRDEGTVLGRAKKLDFTGAGVTASLSGDKATINISGGGGGAPSDAEYVVTALHAGLSAEVLHAGLVHSVDQPPEAHVLDSADHTVSGKTAGQFLRATSATAFAFQSPEFSKGGTMLFPVAKNIIIWRAPFACTVTAVKGYRVSGTGATINARRNGASNHLSSALSLTSADTWMDGGTVQNTAYAVGDKLEIMIVSVSGSPDQVAVQVDYTRP